MAHPRPFRFAAQLGRAPEGTASAWAAQARKVEDLGYATLLMPDHFGDQLAPLPALVAAADATSTLRVGTLVCDNDYRHPLVLAKEAATVDVLSGGRLELGLGAGWMLEDYRQAGMPYDPPGVRIDRFLEGLAIVRGLFGSRQPYSFSGTHYTIADHQGTPAPVQDPLPIIIGGGGRRMLSIAAQKADIVSINVNLREGTGGPETAPDASPARTREKVAWVRQAAGDRFAQLELNTLVGFVHVTDDRSAIVDAMAPHFGLAPSDVVHTPLVLVGTLGQIQDELQWRREEYGISYFSIESDYWDTLAPVVARLAGT